MTDYISREAAIEALEQNWYPDTEFEAVIGEIPAADVRPNVTGRWEYMECSVGRLLVNFPGCSKCKATIMIPMESAKCEFNFCPNCGAKMTEEVEK